MSLTEKQHRIRKMGITGSEIGIIAGVSPWGAPIDVYQSKLGLTERDPPTPAMLRGTMMEPAIKAHYETVTGLVVEDVGTIVHPDKFLAIATPDGYIRSKNRALEIKTAGFRTASHWGEPGTDEIAEYYLPQVTWETAVLEADDCDVPLDDGELKIYNVPFSMPLFERLYEIASRFWHDNILAENPPDPDGSKSYSDYLKELYPFQTRDDYLESTPDMDELIYSLKHCKAMLKQNEQQAKTIENKIKHVLQDAPGMIGHWGKIHWKMMKDTIGPDWKAIATELGADEGLIEKHQKIIRKGYRRFDSRIK